MVTVDDLLVEQECVEGSNSYDVVSSGSLREGVHGVGAVLAELLQRDRLGRHIVDERAQRANGAVVLAAGLIGLVLEPDVEMVAPEG